MICAQCEKEFEIDWRRDKRSSKGPCRFCSPACSRAHAKIAILDTDWKENISKAMKGRPGKPQSEATKLKLRLQSLQRYENGWETRAGRCKKIKYISPTAGEVLLDGSWELAVAQYLDASQLQWERNKKRFPYIDEHSKPSTYCPDFFVSSWKSYLEVKGYETLKDTLKWKQFPEPLIVWKRADLVLRGVKFTSSGKALLAINEDKNVY